MRRRSSAGSAWHACFGDLSCWVSASSSSPDAPRPPVLPSSPRVERAAIRVDLQTEHWKIVSSQFPDATRPQLAVVHTAHDGDWQASIVHCLRSEGFTVFVDALYRYYVGTVRPCLLVSGVPSEAPPTRSTFLLSVPARNSWNPYRLAWNSVMPASRLAFIQQLCPPLPGWMDLAQ